MSCMCPNLAMLLVYLEFSSVKTVTPLVVLLQMVKIVIVDMLCASGRDEIG